MSWQSVAFDGALATLGGSILGGGIAGFVAFKTVQWTQRGDRATTQVAESQRAAEVLMRVLVKTAEDAVKRLRAGDSADGVMTELILEQHVQLPVINDENVERSLREYVEKTTTALKASAMVTQIEADCQMHGQSTVTHVHWRDQLAGLVYSFWVDAFSDLVAFRRRRPQRSAPRTFELPQAVNDDDWPGPRREPSPGRNPNGASV